jgi:D-methionine transport system ATP-binding protein
MNAPLPKQTGAPVLPIEPSHRPVVAFDGVSKIFPSRSESAEVVAVDKIDLLVPEGAIVGVIGRSGAGKSTLIRLINGLEHPTSGHVRVNGMDISALDERALRQA